MADVGTIKATLTADTAQFSRQMDGVQKKLQAVADGTAKVAAAATAATVAIAALGVAALKIAGGFEAGMTRVKAVSQATDSEFQALRVSALELGRTTEFSARQAAEGMGFLAQAGLKTNQIISAMPSVLQLATAGNLELGEAANITTNIVTGMGMELSKLSGANDVLVSAMTGSNVNLQMLGESFKFVGPVAKSAGVSFNEVTAALGLMGNAGIQGSLAGTSLRMALVRLIKPPKEAADALTRLGVSVKDSQGKMRPLVEIMRQLEQRGAKTADIMSIFGIRAGPAMSALLEQGSAAFSKFQKRLEESGGIAKRIQEEQLKTLQGRIKILQSAFEGLAISIGDIMLPAAKALVDTMTDLLSFFNRLTDGAKTAIVVFGAVAGVFAGFLATITGIATALPFVIAGFKAMAVVAGIMAIPLLKIAAVGLVVVAVLGLIVLEIGALKRAWDRDIGGIQTATLAVIDTIQAAFKAMFKGVVAAFKETVRFIEMTRIDLAGFLGLEDDVEGAKAAVAEGLAKGFEAENLEKMFTEPLEEGSEALAKTVKDVAGIFKDTFKEGASFLGGVAEGALEKLGILTKKLGAAPAALAPGAVKPGVIPAGAAAPSTAGTAAIDKASKEVADANLKQAEKAHKEYWAKQDRINQDALSKSEDQHEVINAAVGKVAGAMGDAGSVVQSAIAGFQKGGLIGGIVNLAAELLTRTKAMGEISRLLNVALQAVIDVLEPLLEGLNPIIAIVTELVQILMVLIMPAFKGLLPIFKALFVVLRVFAVVVGGILLAIGKIWNAIISALQAFLRTVGKVIKPLKKVADGLEKMKADTEGLQQSLSDIANADFDTAVAMGDAADATNDMTDAANRATEALTNVPTGYKIAAARFAAQDPLGPAGRITQTGELGNIQGPQQQPGAVLIDKIEINEVANGEQMYREFEKVVARNNFRNTGSTKGAGSAAGASISGRFLVPAVG
jgi:TP901 family phage tail tape measure protein